MSTPALVGVAWGRHSSAPTPGVLAQSNGPEGVVDGLPVRVYHGPGEVDHLTLAFRPTVAHEKLIEISAQWGR